MAKITKKTKSKKPTSRPAKAVRLVGEEVGLNENINGCLVMDKVTGLKGVVRGMTCWEHTAARYSMRPMELNADGEPMRPQIYDGVELIILKRNYVVPVAPGEAPFNYGDIVQDQDTSYNGVVQGLALFLTGCWKVVLQTKAVDRDGRSLKEGDFDAGRCKLVTARAARVDADLPPLAAKTNGGDNRCVEQ